METWLYSQGSSRGAIPSANFLIEALWLSVFVELRPFCDALAVTVGLEA